MKSIPKNQKREEVEIEYEETPHEIVEEDYYRELMVRLKDRSLR